MPKINIVGLGHGDIGNLTLNAYNKINDGNKIMLRTDKHIIVDYLNENNIEYDSYDYAYEEKDKFEDVYEFIAKDLIEMTKNYNEINYLVPGHPLSSEKTSEYLLLYGKDNDVDINIISSMTFISPILKLVQKDITNGTKIIDSLSIDNNELDINTDIIITQVYNKLIASEMKLCLSEVYGDEHEITVLNKIGLKEESLKKIQIHELDRLENFDHTTYIYIPKVENNTIRKYNMYNLIKIMEKLRSKEGCPWDMEQTHESLREFVIEEAYEVVDAIDSEDVDLLTEELGDLLLQIVFHSQIGKEEGYFNINDVISAVCNKMILRHPHVFKNTNVENVDEVLYNWNVIKDREKNINSYTDRLKQISKSIPALSKSFKVQQKAADVGFDWPDISGAKVKFEEEYDELLNAIKENDIKNIEEELGDLIFAIVNISRFLNVNPEVALNKTVSKFISRFEYIEDESGKIDKKMENMTLEEMDELWNRAKIHKK